MTAMRSAYATGRPMVVHRHGHLLCGLVGLIARPGGIHFMTDSYFDPWPSRPPDHFLADPVTGTGPWTCGVHRFAQVEPGEPDYHAWEVFAQEAKGDIVGARNSAEQAMRRMQR